MQTLTLYSTSACHLCELALEIIESVLSARQSGQFELQIVDIADDDSLLELFGIRIPVVQLTGRADDLGWPFDASELGSYLAAVRVQ